MKYYDKEGAEITKAKAEELWHWNNLEYRRVAHDDVDGVEVKTEWNACGYSASSPKPLIFRTEVDGGILSGTSELYSTIAEAQAGHAAMVERVRSAKVALSAAAAALADDYDWRNVFAFAENPMACEGASCAASGFTIEDVQETLALTEGENDGPEWFVLVKLKDGRFAFVAAGCDYTGWDCQAGGTSWVSHDLANLWQFGVTEDARGRFLTDERTLSEVRAIAGMER